MKQILQDLKDGATAVADVPMPAFLPGQVLVRTSASLVSAGTERMLVEFGRAGLLEKARQQPEKIRMVFEKMRTDGIAATLRAVRAKLERPLPLGYSSVGRVLAVAEGVSGIRVGDRVASNGPHAEIVAVPANLCAVVPADVDDEAASFTVVSAIALQGVRLVEPALGETVAVIGLGLIGLITVQILRANGCKVIAMDLDAGRANLAKQFGVVTHVLSEGEDPLWMVKRETNGRGVDAAIIAATTSSDEPVRQAAHMCRKRGRIVLVGVTGLRLSRADFYEKELTFQVSCSYGPGRYDAAYEQRGHDYPIGFVRWTEQRNFEAILGLLSSGALNVRPLITHRFPIADAGRAYDLLTEKAGPLGIVLTYPGGASAVIDVRAHAVQLRTDGQQAAGPARKPRISVIGAGNYAAQFLLPALRKTSSDLRLLASAGGVSSVHAGRKHGFAVATTDANLALADSGTDAVVIATRHDTHAGFVIDALNQGKHVFVEKPLAISRHELAAIVDARGKAARDGFDPIVMTGFNRRFSPLVKRMASLLEKVGEPKILVMTVNAGAIPLDHWTQDRAIGGGRIIGEACHFVDLMRFLVGRPIKHTRGFMIGTASGGPIQEDKATIVLEFSDGSLGTIHYLANGHQSLAKERLEVFCGGAVLQLDNFRVMRSFGWPGFHRMRLWRQDKGNAGCVAAFVEAVASGGPSPIPFEEAVEVTLATFDAVDSMRLQSA